MEVERFFMHFVLRESLIPGVDEISVIPYLFVCQIRRRHRVSKEATDVCNF